MSFYSANGQFIDTTVGQSSGKCTNSILSKFIQYNVSVTYKFVNGKFTRQIQSANMPAQSKTRMHYRQFK